MLDMDILTALGVWGTCLAARLPRYSVWKPGERPRILVVGYNGRQNIGADVRAACIVEQLYRVLGRDHVEVGVLTLDAGKCGAYFEHPTRLVRFSAIYFMDLLDACSRYHMVVLAEGSTLKSNFANALTLGFCEAAGIMRRQGKPTIAYGSEAAHMDGYVRGLAAHLCRGTYFVARNRPSLDVIRDLGLEGHQGTDTAWTFAPAGRAWVENELRQGGWDGERPVLGVAVINPFYWPCRPSPFRLARAAITRCWDHHYEKWYFFSSSSERTRRYRRYVEDIARAVDSFSAGHRCHVVILGMQAIDSEACHDLRAVLHTPAQVVTSRTHDGRQFTGILQALSVLVTSRYHARVLSMAGGVPSIAVSFDERLRHIFQECGHLDDYCLAADDPDLGEHLAIALEKVWARRREVGEEVRRCVPGYLRTMADMGRFIRGFVERSFPGVQLDSEPADWRGFLPALYPALESSLAGDGG